MDVIWTVLSFGGGLLLLYIIVKLLALPLKLLLKLVVNALIGAVMLILFNLFGSLVGLSIAVNPLNALIAGVLGVPGVILLLVLTLIL